MNTAFINIFLVFLILGSGCKIEPSGSYYILPDGSPDAHESDGSSVIECVTDEQCEDGIQCTQDVCDKETGKCVHNADHQYCFDDSVCNGEEYCDLNFDCQVGIPYQGCFDFSPCTIDYCIEPESVDLSPICEHSPMDRDGDGHIDEHCFIDPFNETSNEYGDDCDDLDALRHPGAQEFCFDNIDNDCDGQIDTLDSDCILTHESCENPRDLIHGILQEGFTNPTTGDVDISCGQPEYPDVVYRFELPNESDVTLDVWGNNNYVPYISIQQDCGNLDTEVRCIARDTYERIFERAMPAGTYYLVIESWEDGIFQILLNIESMTLPPEGDNCSSAIELTDGATHQVNMREYSSLTPVSCIRSDMYADVVYQFLLEEEKNVRYEVSGQGFTPYVAISENCGDILGEIICDGSNPHTRSLCSLSPGTYSMIVRGNPVGALDVSLSFSDAGIPPENDQCSGALDISTGGTFSGTLLCSAQDSSQPSCDNTLNHDVFYTFTLSEPQDVDVSLTMEDGIIPTLTLIQSCESTASEVLCLREASPQHRFHSLDRGTYFVMIGAEYEANFDLSIQFLAPTL